MKIKSLFAALLCVVFVLAFSSCAIFVFNDNRTTSATTTAGTTTAPTPTSPTVTTTAPSGPVNGPGDAVADDIFNDNWAPGLGN